MTLATETFGTFTDALLTTSFNGVYDMIHYTDESDNPQDRTLYVGSLGSGGADTVDRKLQALSDPGVDDVTLTIVDILPEWAVATAYVVGDCVQPTTPNGFRYRCVTAGTSHATTEPVWPLLIGGEITDGTVIWRLVSAKHETTEITLALTEAALATNTPGDPLILSTDEILSGTANAITVWIRVINQVNTVSDNTTTPEIAIRLNDSIELEYIA